MQITSTFSPGSTSLNINYALASTTQKKQKKKKRDTTWALRWSSLCAASVVVFTSHGWLWNLKWLHQEESHDSGAIRLAVLVLSLSLELVVSQRFSYLAWSRKETITLLMFAFRAWAEHSERIAFEEWAWTRGFESWSLAAWCLGEEEASY